MCEGAVRSLAAWAWSFSGGRHEACNSVAQCLRLLGAHQPGHLLAIAQEHQRGPELHAVAAAQRAARAILHLDVGHIGAVLQSLCNQWLGTLAMAAPGCAEFEHGGAGQAVGLLAARRLG